MKRGFLLPEGCKDLIDILKPKWPQLSAPYLTAFKPQLQKFKPTQPSSPKHPLPLPPIVGEVIIPASTSTAQLAALLGQKPFTIIADVMQLGFFVSANQLLDFEIISSVARKYGFIANRGS
jgi:hypothetical protein